MKISDPGIKGIENFIVKLQAKIEVYRLRKNLNDEEREDYQSLQREIISARRFFRTATAIQ